MSSADAMESRRRSAAIVAELRATLERSSNGRRSISQAGIEQSLTDARRRASVTAHWGIAPSWPVLGQVEVLVKRAMRILLRWYINPIVEQQNEFNLAVLAALYELEANLHAISNELEEKQGNTLQDDAN